MKRLFALLVALVACACGSRSGLVADSRSDSSVGGQSDPPRPSDAGVSIEPDASHGGQPSDASHGGQPGDASHAGQPSDAGALPHIELTASTDLEEYVQLSWTAPEGYAPTGYIVQRDGLELAKVLGATLRYQDVSAGPASVAIPTRVQATRGTRSDAVQLTWASAVTTGARHSYQVIALAGAPQGLLSNVAQGARSSSFVRYEFSRDGGEFYDAGTETSFDDTAAPYGTIRTRSDATPRYPYAYVRLRILDEPAIVPPPPIQYRVRVRTKREALPASEPAEGYRGVGKTVVYRWQRSVSDADETYADLPDVSGGIWFDGSPELDASRYYRAVLETEGARGQTQGTRTTTLRLKSLNTDRYGRGCAIRSDDRIVCWGRAYTGEQLPEPPGDAFKQVGFGWGHACGIRLDDRLVCWGNNESGQVPAGPSSEKFKSLSLGLTHSCGLQTDGKLVCWGRYHDGTPLPAAPNDTFKSLSGGLSSTCAIRSDDKVTCWSAKSVIATEVQGDPVYAGTSTDTFQSLSTGQYPACGVRSDGQIFCLNDNTLRTPPNRLSGVPFKSVSVWNRLNYGDALTCAIRADDKLACWDQGFGIDNTWKAPSGVTRESFRSVETWASGMTCGLRFDGTVACWGSGPQMPSLEKLEQVTAGGRALCGLTTDRRAVCWGDSTTAQAPRGPSTKTYKTLSTGSDHTCAVGTDDTWECWTRSANATVGTPPQRTTFKTLSAARNYTCGIRSDDKVQCWGHPADDQDQTQSPEGSFKSLSSGGSHACGINTDDKIECWGNDAKPPPTSDRFKQVSAGESHTCAITLNDQLVCWGGNSNGQTTIPALGAVKHVSAGAYFTCAIDANDHVACWGDNRFGQSSPVSSVERFRSVHAGATFACGRRFDNRLVCWGRDFDL